MNKTVVKIVSIIMVLSLTMLTFAACGGKQDYEKNETAAAQGQTEATTNAQEPEPEAGNINPLTGVADLSDGAINARPIAIMVENHPDARPQWGMSTPDIIVEGLVEGDITRMMWLYADVTKIPKIGPVRSARHDYVEIAAGLNAIYAHWGGSGEKNGTYAYAAFKKYDVDHIDAQVYEGKYFKRESSKSAPHNGYTNGELLAKAISDLKIETNVKDNNWRMFNFVQSGVRYPFGEGTGNANEVTAIFSANYKYTYKFDETNKVYYSYLNGKAVTDGSTGAQVGYTNIIIMLTDVGGVKTSVSQDKKLREWDLTEGNALYISQGAGEKISWKKGDGNSPLKFYGTDGKELIINKGKTWIGVVPTSQTDKISIK